ncbi:Protein of unknown function [Gryllus bimaculatus]|nr:Protein of unknown function [Gryllus bimaculatus]
MRTVPFAAFILLKRSCYSSSVTQIPVFHQWERQPLTIDATGWNEIASPRSPDGARRRLNGRREKTLFRFHSNVVPGACGSHRPTANTQAHNRDNQSIFTRCTCWLFACTVMFTPVHTL